MRSVATKDRIPVAVLGGGAYAAQLAEVISAVPDFPPVELRLHARRPGPLATIAQHVAERFRMATVPHVALACPQLDDALEGVAAIVLLIRVGGLGARAHDESFPMEFALVGDEGVGVGGMANAWRTLPVLDGIAARILERAPDARVLNMMAPLGITTRLLVERGLRTVGLCELPHATLARWTAHSPSANAPELAYAGLNHLGFFWCPTLAAVDHPVLRAAVHTDSVPEELLSRLGAAPLHYYVDVFEPAAAERLGRTRKPGRAVELAKLQVELLREFRDRPGAFVAELGRRATPWFDDALVPALHAVLAGPAFHSTLNLPNGGALDEVGAQVIVELEGRLDARGARFDGVRPRPESVRAVLGRLARAEECVYRGTMRQDRGSLAEALEALPIALPSSNGERARLLDCVCRPLSSLSPDQVQP